MMDGELSDSMSLSGKLGQKGDFDRRQKKKWVYYNFISQVIELLHFGAHFNNE